MGAFGALVPGFPGSAVALLGLVAYAGLTNFEVVTREALVLAAVFALGGVLGQLVAPVLGSRALGGSAGAATGAALGAVVGVFLPLPMASALLAVLGAIVVGVITSRRAFLAWIRGVVGASTGCLGAVAADLVAVFAIGAILGVADFMSRVG